MIPFQKIAKRPVKNTKGFTLMELMVVIAIVGVLAAFAVFNYIPMRAKALDSIARSDARNVISTVVDAIMNNSDVDYNKNDGLGGAVGNKTVGGAPRKPVFILSDGVVAVISGDSAQNPGGNNTIFEARIYHSGGTRDFFCSVDAHAGTSTGPN